MIGTTTWFDLDDRGLSINADDGSPDFEDVGLLFSEILRMGESYQWGLGDLFVYAEDRFGEQAAQLVDAVHIRPKTLQNIVYVCRRFPRRNRVPGLRFSHHAAAASLFGVGDHPEWEEAGWLLLQDAAHQGLTEDEVTERSKRIRGVEPRGESISFEKRSVQERIGAIVKKIEALRKDLPSDWYEEADWLDEAIGYLNLAALGAEKREQEKEAA